MHPERKFKDAMPPCDKVLNEDPQNQRANLLRASALMGLGQNVDARNVLKTLIAAKPDFLDAQLQLGVLNITEKKYKEQTRSSGASTNQAKATFGRWMAW